MHKAGAAPTLRCFTTALSTCMAAEVYQELRDFVEEAASWNLFKFDVATYNGALRGWAWVASSARVELRGLREEWGCCA
jgi:hypothetical protein